MWTALFNWIFAKQHGGTFVLRIEDTDQKRLVEGSRDRILEAMDWYNITPDEGPQQGGAYGPYEQSQRLEIYTTHVRQLLENGSAYYCFCTAERLESLRADQAAHKLPPKYDKHCATLDPAEALVRINAGEAHTVRLKLPSSGTIEHDDIIRGHVSFRLDLLDDSVIMKSDGFPTYHLANVVDDHLMNISHVIRAEEWLPSVPKHLFLYRAFGWEPPKFAHLPLLLGSDKSKLSKRHGATAALTFRDLGYLPETMVNFLALMGWHPKGEDEILTIEQIVEQFRLEDVNPSGAVFDQTKLDWMNGHYLRSLPVEQLLERTKPFWKLPKLENITNEQLQAALVLIRERMKVLPDVNEINTVFTDVWNIQVPTFDRALLIPKKGTAEATTHHLQQTALWLNQYDGTWDAETLKTNVISAIAAMGKKNGEILWPLRVALSLQTASPDVFDLLAFLGREESIRRINVFAQ